MELGIAAIGITCVALCAMPFVLTNRNTKNKEKLVLMSLKDVAKQHDCEITEYEIFGHYAIGIDNVTKSVCFILNTRKVIKQQFVNLSTVNNCEITNVSRSLAQKGKIIDRLNLNLSPIDKNKPDTVLEFYDADVNYQLSGELQSIEKWNKLIKNMLKSKK
ncbi:hypothetical protein [Maribacter sp. ACAM166]|uniref:hypothetical protein n=1 Tax=Maribacter sp. ACAM166 TaxID=2508996 RepID=UPI0010FD3DA8|nr:hypothetical protein [Maribacter sp. ACAM166]TLP80236.1 hypothetical protein ES765_08570 [Maribacter sp. ACAM166]